MGRIEKVNQQVKREISYILQRDLGDPRFRFVTITEAIVSKDLRHSKVFYSVLGDPDKRESVKRAFEEARGLIRKLLGQRLTIRYTPELFFSYDESLERSARIDQRIQEIRNELNQETK